MSAERSASSRSPEYGRAEIAAEIARSLLPTLCAAAPRSLMVSRARRDRQRLVRGDPRHLPRSILGGKGGRQRPHDVAGDGVAMPASASSPPRPGGRRPRNAGYRAGTPSGAAPSRREWYPGDIGPDHRLISAQAVRDSGRAGRGDHLPRLRRGLLHHRDRAPCGWWRPRVIVGESNGDDWALPAGGKIWRYRRRALRIPSALAAVVSEMTTDTCSVIADAGRVHWPRQSDECA